MLANARRIELPLTPNSPLSTGARQSANYLLLSPNRRYSSAHREAGKMGMTYRSAALAFFITVFGTCGGAAWAQIAFASDTQSNLYKVNLQTGAATLIGNSQFLEGLAYDIITG